MPPKKPKKVAVVRASDDDYTAEERELILRYVKDELRVPEIRAYLKDIEERVSGNKDTLVERLAQAIDSGSLTYSDLVHLLDGHAPWKAQHVTLLGEPTFDASEFRTPATFEERLRRHHASRVLREKLPLILPEKLTVSQIVHNGERIRVVAVERRDGWFRDKARDRTKEEGGTTVEWRAFVRDIVRGLIVFEWDLVQNHAMLQVSQLPSGWDYDEARTRITHLLARWIDLNGFGGIDLRRAVSSLHKEEELQQGGSRVRSHGIEYETAQGRRLQGRSATARDSVLGEASVDGALQQVRSVGVGRTGNFYWRLDGLEPALAGEEAHVVINGAAGRVNFRTDNSEEVVRHVLAGIRTAST